MTTKLHAARIACGAGIDMYIVNGNRPEILYDLFDGKEIGTQFVGVK
jgi:glutamate 5-kinase